MKIVTEVLEKEIERRTILLEVEKNVLIKNDMFNDITALKNALVKLNMHVVSKSLRIVSGECVNSKWVADWVAMEGREHCQCIVGCKIKVEFAQNGHKPYPYIVDQLEYEKLVDKTKD